MKNILKKAQMNLLIVAGVFAIAGLFIFAGNAHAATNLFADNFQSYSPAGNEIDSYAGSHWSESNGVKVQSIGGFYGKVAELNSSDADDKESMWTTINTSGYTNIKLKYDRKTFGLENDQQDLFKVEYKADGGSWVTLYSTNNNRDWDNKNHDLPEANSIIIRFSLLGTNDNDKSYVDNVKVEGDFKPATIIASKVICDREEDLPNWGDHGATIGANTAADYVAASGGKCHLAEWNFQWAYDPQSNPGNNEGEQLTPWNTFTNTVQINDLSNDKIWLREVWNDQYVPFSGDYTKPFDTVSAEFYCNGDTLNYDNYEWIDNLNHGQTYYCVAFNALAAYCGDGSVDPGEQCDSTSYCTDQCVQNYFVDGYKWNDLDGDGAKTADEPLIGDWTIRLKQNDVVIDTDVTDTEGDYFGHYRFENVPAGEYTVCEVQQDGWNQTFPVNGECHNFTLSGPLMNVPQPNFGNQLLTYNLMGFKWNDLNGNGERDCEFVDTIINTNSGIQGPPNCEPLLPGWTIQLKKNNQIIKTDVTSDDVNGLYGGYYFDDLLAGTYEICEVLQDGWSQTFPESPVCHTVTLPLSQLGDTCSTNIAIVRPLTSVSEQEPLPMCNFGNQEISLGCFPNFLETNQPNFVDLSDFAFFGKCYGTQTGDANYLDICDVNDDGFVNDYDANVFANHYNKPFICGQDPIIYPLCGNAIVEGTEQCDGNKVECQKVVGDVVYNGYKYCDNYGQTTALNPTALEKIDDIKVNSCIWTTDECQTLCGDGFINQETETCDDGNVVSGDGCSDICVTEVPPITPEVPKIEPVKSPILTIAKSVESGTYYPGDKVNYIVTIKNTGTDIAYNVRLADTMAAGFTYDDASEGSWFFSDLKVGQEMNHIYTMTIGTSVVPGTYTNTAQVSADKVAPVIATADLAVIAKPGAVLGAETEGAVEAETTLPAAGIPLVDYLIMLVGLSGLAIILKK